MDHDVSDILGGKLPLPPESSFLNLSSLNTVKLLASATGVILTLITWHFLHPHIRQWRERRYRKAIRRRHGIPDNDNRPFNVAYAAAKAAQKSENGSTGGSRTSSHQASVTPEELSLRQRNGFATGSYDLAADEMVPSQHVDSRRAPSVNHVSSSVNGFAQGRSGFGDRYTTAYTAPSSRPVYANSSYQPSFVHGNGVPVAAVYDDRVRDDNQQEEQPLSGPGVDEEVVHENGIPVEHVSDYEMEVDETSPQHPSRASKKRMAEAEDDEFIEESRDTKRDKRARKVSLETRPIEEYDIIEDEDMDVEEPVDDVAPRGKKRERVDAGSTYGDDDLDAEEEERPRRHRKRRTVTHKAAAAHRGQKRSRDVDVESDEESGRLSKSARKSRSKRDSDMGSIHEDVSQDPLCKGKRIGEEWESNGVRYKVGPNGQRLRQALVKKIRSRFPMPTDSQHPDRHSNIDVFVETWLTEEEYKAAKEHHELAWQDSPKSPAIPASESELMNSPSAIGKSLLWSSTSSPQKEASTPVRGPFVQSALTNGGLRTSLLQSQGTFGRRISSPFTPAIPSTPESPKIRPSKSYSKWEKQDLEAAAMLKIREKTQKEARTAEEKDAARKVDQKKTETTTAPSSTTNAQGPAQGTSSINFPSMTKAAEPAAKPPVPLFSVPSTNGTASKPTTIEPPKLSINTGSSTTTATDKPKFTFGMPSKPAESTSNTTTSSAPQPSGSQQPAQQATSSIPNFFGKPATTTSTATSAPASSIFGTPAASSSTAPKSAFGFKSSSATQAAPTSAFGTPATDTKKPAGPVPSNPNSLLSRLGPLATQQPSSTSTTTAPSTFSLGPTNTPVSSAAAPTAGQTTQSQTASASQPPPPKFNFGFSKPTAPTASTATPSSTAAPVASSSTIAGDSSKATTPSFTFGAPNPPAASSAPTASTASSSTQPPPKFNFGVTGPGVNTPSSSSSPFGSATTSAPAAGPSTSNLFGGNTGPTKSTAPVSVFGAPSGGATSASTSQPAASSSGSVFSGAGAGVGPGASGAPKSAFGFGSTPSAPSASSTGSGSGSVFGQSSMAAGGEAPKSSFLFAPSAATSSATAPPAAAAAANTTQQKSPFSFNFGAPASNSTSTNNTTTQLTPSAFGFGAPSTSTTSGSVFGSSNTTGQTQK